jgi:hypothetical protein
VISSPVTYRQVCLTPDKPEVRTAQNLIWSD